MNIKDLCKNAIIKNHLIKFLKGEDDYNIRDREGLSHDYLAALVEGIYEMYKENNMTKKLYEESLKEMMNSEDVANLVHAYNYIRLQIYAESKNIAPFELNTDVYIKLKEQINLKEEELKKFRKIPEYGSKLENGAYQFIGNMDNFMEREYGRKVL